MKTPAVVGSRQNMTSQSNIARAGFTEIAMLCHDDVESMMGRQTIGHVGGKPLALPQYGLLAPRLQGLNSSSHWTHIGHSCWAHKPDTADVLAGAIGLASASHRALTGHRRWTNWSHWISRLRQTTCLTHCRQMTSQCGFKHSRLHRSFCP